MGEDLRGGRALDQGILNCVRTGSKFFLLTDGRVWEIFESGSDAPKISFDLSDPSEGEICLKAMALWRPSVASGKMTVAETPVVGFPEDDPKRTQPKPGPPPPITDDDWQRLTEVKTQIGQKVLEVQFPDGDRVETKIWRDVLLGVVRWLTNKEMLNASHCPIKSRQSSTRCMVNTKPNHEDGSDFSLPGEVNGLYIAQSTEHHHNLRIILAIIQRVSQDPSQFKVRVS